MNEKQTASLWVYAFRYCIERKTAAPWDFVNIALSGWEDIPISAQANIAKELNRAIGRNEAIRHNEDWQRLKTFIEGMK